MGRVSPPRGDGQGESLETQEESLETPSPRSAGVKLKWKSSVPRHTRHISVADFKRLGFEDQAAIDVKSGDVIEVSSEVAEVLRKTDPRFSIES